MVALSGYYCLLASMLVEYHRQQFAIGEDPRGPYAFAATLYFFAVAVAVLAFAGGLRSVMNSTRATLTASAVMVALSATIAALVHDSLEMSASLTPVTLKQSEIWNQIVSQIPLGAVGAGLICAGPVLAWLGLCASEAMLKFRFVPRRVATGTTLACAAIVLVSILWLSFIVISFFLSIGMG